MEKKNRRYDFIIYGGTPAGIIFAVNKRGQGKKVLLINHYGFLGGSISSAFNCLQSVRDTERSPLYNALLSRLRGERQGILYSNGSSLIINPESMKMQLMQMIDSSGIDLLFHVTPINCQINHNDTLELELAAKEGNIKVSGETLIDASENHSVKQLCMDEQFSEVHRRVNIFVTKSGNLEFNSFHDFLYAIKLNDNRYFVSLNCNCSKSIINNNYMDKALSEFNSILTSAGSRIQLMPAENYSFYEFISVKNINSKILTIEGILGRNFQPNEQLLKAGEIENYLNERG